MQTFREIADKLSMQSPHLKSVYSQVASEIKGKDKLVELAMAAFLSGGHLLLEGPPGTGKTSLARSLANAFRGSFRRIQMTSDMLPSDVIGIIRLKPDHSEFEFRQGPIFTHFLLVDELNRTSPKTQSALLEAMAEGTVSIDGQTYSLPNPFFVVATQNPLESQGVYPLAESQLDRFMMLLSFEFPGLQDEIDIYQRSHGQQLLNLYPKKAPDESDQLSLEEVLKLRTLATQVHIEKSILEYATSLVRATRTHPKLLQGASVRAGLQLIAASKAMAFVRGREFVIPEDIFDLTIPVLGHRLLGRVELGLGRTQQCQIIQELMEAIRPPK